MNNEHYLTSKTYDALVSALLNLEPCGFTGKIGEDQIKIALGEVGDVWPARIKGDY